MSSARRLFGYAVVVAAENCAQQGCNPPRRDPPSAHD